MKDIKASVGAYSSVVGIDFVVSSRAVKRTEHWPNAKRSRRLQKKMTKLRGPQYTEEPAAYRMADGRMIIHPNIYKALLSSHCRNLWR